MATNANLDWTQSAAAGYVPACASGNINAHSTDDAEMSFLLQRDASASDSRFQDGSFREYDTIEGNGNAHEDSQANVSTPSTVKPSEHLTSEDPRIGLTIPSTPPRDFEQQHQSWSTSHGELQNFDGMPGITGAGRKSIAKPKPEPSNPRLFRPFTIDESKDTMMLKWKTPPVIGSYMLFPNKRLRYVPLPPKLEMVREKLFRIEKPILLKNSQEVANYLPHITNLWRKTVQRVKSNEDGLQVEYWHCRSKKRKDYSRKDAVRGLRNRERKADNMFGDLQVCRMRVCVTSYTRHANTPENHSHWGACKCIPEWVHFKRACADPNLTEHTHDQELIEAYKHPEAIAVLARLKVEEGNSAAGVVKWLRKECGSRLNAAYRFDSIDVANTAKAWREDHKDLVLREEVPEDDEEMATMRRCIDAIFEADPDPLRAALREVCKDSHDLTKRALAILEKAKPAAEPMSEPWKLTEGDAAIADVPLTGGSKILKRSGIPQAHQNSPQVPHPVAPQGALPAQGLRPLAPHTALDPPHQQAQQAMLGAFSQSPGASSQPGAPTQSQSPTPLAAGQAQNSLQVQNHVEIRYLQKPPPPPRTHASAHPITISLEIPTCPSPTCQQCKALGYRGLAGRTFFFQGRFHTEAHFSQLQDLFRNPKQILDEKYSGILSGCGTMFAPPVDRPRGPMGTSQNPVHNMPAPTSATQHPVRYQYYPGVPPAQAQPQTPYGPRPQAQLYPATARIQPQYNAPSNQTTSDNHHSTAVQTNSQPHDPGSVPETANEPETLSHPPPDEQNTPSRPQDNSLQTSIYDQELPVPTVRPREDEEADDDDGDQPPAKRQRQQFEEAEHHDGEEEEDDEGEDD